MNKYLDYLLSVYLNPENVGVGMVAVTITKTFYIEYEWHVRRNGLEAACVDYMKGLPSGFAHEFSDYAISKLFDAGTLPRPRHDGAADRYWIELGRALAYVVRLGLLQDPDLHAKFSKI